MTEQMTDQKIVTREEWLGAREKLLEREKEHTRLGDELARQRRELPWVRVEEDYLFDTDQGTKTLRELFEGRSQLLVYHFMFGPSYEAGDPVNSSIADAYAQAYRDEVSRLVVVDAPLPGTSVFDRLRADPRVWHFAFHCVRDVPEMLIAGRERQYLQAFFNAQIFNTGAISENDLDIYTSAYTAPGAMRAGFELYRAFDRDIDENRETLKRNGKLSIPVLAIGGATSTSGPLVEEMMREVAEDVTGLRISGAAHWIPEESPAALAAGLLEFLAPAS